MGSKLKEGIKRGFVEHPKYSNSWYKIDVDNHGIEVTLADCNRSISWYFGKKDAKDKRGKKKSATLKKLFDEIYDYYHEDG